jgi:hypothetical protein
MFDNHEQVQELLNGLHHLKYNNHEVLLFHVTDRKTELDFEFDDRPYQFVDLETQHKMKLFPAQVREVYRSRMQAYFQDLAIKCGQFKIDFIAADINEDLNKILSAYLIKRMKMH